MNNIPDIPSPDSQSPFDAIRRVREDGSEYWSARDLMPLLGYSKWERFSDSIERAVASAKSTGHKPADHFPGAGKKVQIGSGTYRTVGDFHLTRFAAYLVAMNGDPRKPEVAAAQAYFAVKTREAEVAPTATLALPQNYAEALRELANAVEAKELAEKRAEEAEAEVAVLEPKARDWESFLGAKGSYDTRQAAKMLRTAGVHIGNAELRACLVEAKWCFRKKMRDGSLGPLEAYAHKVGSGHLHVKPQSSLNADGSRTTRTPQVRLTPKGINGIQKFILPARG